MNNGQLIFNNCKELKTYTSPVFQPPSLASLVLSESSGVRGHSGEARHVIEAALLPIEKVQAQNRYDVTSYTFT